MVSPKRPLSLTPVKWLGWLGLAAGLVSLACSLSQNLSQPVPTLEMTATVQAEQTLTPAGQEANLSTDSTPTATLLPAFTATPLPSPTIEPDTATPTLFPETAVIGYSVQGRPLEVWRFGEGARRRMIVAGIHGGYEWNTIVLADELIAYLQANPELVPPDKMLFILRNLNPDGEARAHGPDGRANANGVDLNRNFPVNWQKDWRRSGCWQLRPITAGEAPASEPETQALMAFIQENPVEALISYHSAGLGIFPAGDPLHPASVSLAESMAAVSGYPYPPKDTGCYFTGLLANWAASQGIAAVDIELTNHYDSDFQINLAVLSRFLTWEP